MWQRILDFWRGISALFFRSLRVESRSFRMHLLWLAFMVVIYCMLWIARSITSTFGAPGLYFFRFIMYADAVFIAMLGVSFFSTVISEEKEEDTLGLMTMAGISPLGILLGKSTSRVFQVALLLAIQYPFTLLSITMGGLLPTQVYSAYAALLSYTILLANVGLLCSVACRTSRNAAALVTFSLLCYGGVAAFSFLGMSYLTMDRGWTVMNPRQAMVLRTLDWLSQTNVFLELNEATVTGREFLWSPQIISNASVGILCFFLSLLLFGFVAKEPVQDSGSRGLVARRTTRGLRLFSAGRVWPAALAWKDFFFTSGGWAGLIIRGLLYLSLYVMCYASNRPWDASNYSIRWGDVTQGFQAFAHPLLALDIALCFSRVFHDEIKGQTLSSLLMLPKSVPAIVYSKFAGCGLALLPGVFALVWSIFLTDGGRFLAEAGTEPGFLWWLMNLLLLIHLTAVNSLFLRSGAFVLALGMVIGSMIMTGLIIAMLTFGRGDPSGFVFGICSVGIVCVCAGCHAVILARLPVLGTR